MVARLVGFQRRVTFTPPRKQPIERTDFYPDISLITYTDDPGFFVVRDKPGRRERHFIRDPYFHSLIGFGSAGVPRDALKILDRDRFDRILKKAEPLSSPRAQ